MDSQMLLGGLGGRELILIVAIALLLAGASRLTRLQRARSTEGTREGVDGASSRAYLDRLIGPARGRVSADAPPVEGSQPRIGEGARDPGAVLTPAA
jgi:hypothetical protein